MFRPIFELTHTETDPILTFMPRRSRHIVIRLLLLGLFLSGNASAWDMDNCGRDLVFDVGSASAAAAPMQSAEDAAGEAPIPAGTIDMDLCGHCSHASAHLLGVAMGTTAFNSGDAVKISRSLHLRDTFTHLPLFRPPRFASSFV